MKEETTEEGRSIMMRKALIMLDKEVREPVQRKSLFRISCKTKDRVCKVIKDIRSIDNLVSMEMVEKLNLETTTHSNPYRVSWLQKGQQVMVSQQC
jgi:hypothetical protein